MVGRGMQDRIEAAKNEIRNLRFYQSEIKRIKERIEQIEYDEANVKGVLYSKQPGSTNPLEANLRRLDLIEKKEELEEQVYEFCILMNRIYRILNAMEQEERDLVEAVLIEKRKYSEVAKEKNISSTSLLNYYIDRAIEKAIKKS